MMRSRANSFRGCLACQHLHHDISLVKGRQHLVFKHCCRLGESFKQFDDRGCTGRPLGKVSLTHLIDQSGQFRRRVRHAH